MALPKKCFKMFFSFFLLGCPASPVINSVFGRRYRKTASRGREDTTVWYRETMFSQMVSYDFLLPGLLHEYSLYLVSTHPGKPTRRCEPKEGSLRCSKRFDHRSHFISFVIVWVKDKSHLMMLALGNSEKCSRCIQTYTPFTVGSH